MKFISPLEDPPATGKFLLRGLRSFWTQPVCLEAGGQGQTFRGHLLCSVGHCPTGSPPQLQPLSRDPPPFPLASILQTQPRTWECSHLTNIRTQVWRRPPTKTLKYWPPAYRATVPLAFPPNYVAHIIHRTFRRLEKIKTLKKKKKITRNLAPSSNHN